MAPPVATSSSAFQTVWNVRYSAPFHQPIRGSEKGIGNLVFVTLQPKVQLRSTFQRSRGIICKRLAPFSLERSGHTCGRPSRPYGPHPPSLPRCAPSLSHSFAALPRHTRPYGAPHSPLRRSPFTPSLRSRPSSHMLPRCAPSQAGAPRGSPLAHAKTIISSLQALLYSSTPNSLLQLTLYCRLNPLRTTTIILSLPNTTLFLDA